MDRRKFIKSCIFAGAGCAIAGSILFVPENCNKISELAPEQRPEWIKTSDGYINIVEIHLAEHCNLNCKYCTHFSPIAEKEFYDFKIFKRDLKRFCKLTEGKVRTFNVLGGEPLLNKDIAKYFSYIRKLFPESQIILVTNSVLLDSMCDDFWDSMEQNKVLLLANNYNLGYELNWASIIEKAQKHHINYYHEYEYEGFREEYIKDHFRPEFARINLDPKGSEDIVKRYTECGHSAFCPQLTKGGKFYSCFLPAYIRHLNKKFGTKFEVTKNDYINIFKVKNMSEIIKYLNTPAEFCRYCKPFSYWLKWESAIEHDLSEWVWTEES